MPKRPIPAAHDLALRYDAEAILTAGAARAAAEMAARYNRRIPPAAIEDAVDRFRQRLQTACEVAGAVPSEMQDEEEADA
jgi:hypothetical protein